MKFQIAMTPPRISASHTDCAASAGTAMMPIRIFNRENAFPVDWAADQGGIIVKCSDDVEAVVTKSVILQQRPADVAHADDDRVVGVVVAQKASEIVDQVLCHIADLRAAARADNGEVFPHLHIVQMQRLGNGRG